jgi:dTDP-glucose 4,6-dehydratase
MGVKVEIECDRKRIRAEKSEVLRLICDNKKARKLLNWKPSYTLEEGLAKTIDFAMKNIQHYKPHIYNV